MNLDWSDEQAMLRASVARFLEREHGAGTLWAQFADLGWLALPLPAAHGGFGATMVDVGLVMEGLGRARRVEPYLSTVVLAAGLIERVGTPEQQAQLLPKIAAGSLRIADATAAPPAGARAPCAARREGGAWRLSGDLLAHDGPACDQLLTIAKLPEGGRGAFLLRRDAAGVEAQPFPTLDGRAACIIRLHDAAPAAWLGGAPIADEAVARAAGRAVAAACAEAVGSIRYLVDGTVAYAKTRVQFGRPIGDNQVVKHRLVDMLVACEEARAITLRALLLCEGDGGDVACAGARLKVARCASAVAEQAIQLHGAMGVTEELEVGHHVKRLLAFDMRLGTSRQHLQRRIQAIAEAWP